MPPKPLPSHKFVKPPCVHKFVFIESIKKTESGSYQIGYKRVDRFFCEKCLEAKQVVREEWSRDPPEWW